MTMDATTVAEVSAVAAEAAAPVATAAVVETAAKAGILNMIANVPMGAVINIAVFTGLAIFTAWVMIRRTIKIHKKSKSMESETGAFNQNTTIVEDILHNRNYTGDATIFDTLDPITQDVAANMRPVNDSKKPKGKKKKSKPEALKTRRELREEKEELADALRGVIREDRAGLKHEWRGYGRAMQKSAMAEIDEIARKMGLPVDPYKVDDDIPQEILDKYGDILL